MKTLEIPIFKKVFELYQTFHMFRSSVPKQDRYTIWQKCENTIIDMLEQLLMATQLSTEEKLLKLEMMSVKLNMLRVFLRMTKDIKAINHKKYIQLELIIDEIGRMLGGWIKSSKVEQ